MCAVQYDGCQPSLTLTGIAEKNKPMEVACNKYDRFITTDVTDAVFTERNFVTDLVQTVSTSALAAWRTANGSSAAFISRPASLVRLVTQTTCSLVIISTTDHTHTIHS